MHRRGAALVVADLEADIIMPSSAEHIVAQIGIDFLPLTASTALPTINIVILAAVRIESSAAFFVLAGGDRRRASAPDTSPCRRSTMSSAKPQMVMSWRSMIGGFAARFWFALGVDLPGALVAVGQQPADQFVE